MSLRGASRPHSIVRGRTWSSSFQRQTVAAALLVLCACASFILVWRPSFTRSSSELLTSLSGHSYHPKLCNSPGDLSSSGGSSSHPACGELHDPQLAEEVVQLPSSPLLLSDDAQVRNLQQLLQAAAKEHWPLPLARRVVSMLLQGAVPPVHTSSTGTGNTQQQQQQPAQTLPLSAAESGHTAGWRFATQAAAVLGSRGGNNLVPCSFDPSLPTEFHTRFLFSALWPAQAASDTSSSSTTALANSVLQLLSTVALVPPGYAWVSVSVPPDADAGSLFWLDLLQLLAAPLGVPVHAVQQAAAAGNTTAADMAGLPQLPSHSTSHIARAALSAFFPSWQGAPATAAAAQGSQQESGQLNQGRRLRQQNHQQQQQLGGEATSNSPDPSRSSGRIKHGSCPAGAPAPSCYQPEYVVLFEPAAFFCSGDLLRLMEYPEDLVCGLHLDEFKPVQLRHKQHHHRHRHRAAARKLQQAAAAAAAGGSSALHEGPMAAAVAAAGQAVIKPEVPPEFEMHSLRAAYDATREITGDLLSAHAPYFSHSPSQELARAGLPVPVYCCWGGVAKLRAGPLAAGLRFRAGEEGECRPPDPMSLLCDDLWRTGNSHILLVRAGGTLGLLLQAGQFIGL